MARVAETKGGKDEKSLRIAVPEETGCATVECTPTQRHPPLPGYHTLEEKSQYFPALALGRKKKKTLKELREQKGLNKIPRKVIRPVTGKNRHLGKGGRGNSFYKNAPFSG